MDPCIVVGAIVVLLSSALGGCTAGTVVTGSDGGASEGGGEVPVEGGSGSEGGVFCTPGGYAYCRCADRTEGTKRCRADGKSFDSCATGSGPCQ